MAGKEKQTSRQLERLLLTSAVPGSSSGTTKRPVESAEASGRDDGPAVKKKRKAFLDSALQAVSTDAQLTRLVNVAECQCGDADERLLVVTTKTVFFHEPAKHVSRLRLVLKDDGCYYIQVLLKVVEEGTIDTTDDFKHLCDKLANPAMKFCPGLSIEEYEQCKKIIGYDVKNMCISDEPFKRVASKQCFLWYRMPRNLSRDQKKSHEVMCGKCRILRSQLKGAVKRTSEVTPETKLRRQQASSSFPMRYLSPESLEKRKMNIKLSKYKEKRKIKRFVPKKVIHEEKQLEDMSKEQLQSLISVASTSHSGHSTTSGELETSVKIETQSALRCMLEQDSESVCN